MRYQGKITDWKDDLGYGFVVLNGGDTPNTHPQRAFVHIKQFSSASLRPKNGDLITYELSIDKNKRTFAKNINFVNRRSIQNNPNKHSALGVKFSLIFCALLAVTVLAGWAPLALLLLYLGLSTLTFINYALDKSAAKHNLRRTPESQLHLLSLIGGWPGAALAQSILRHKSVKKEFQVMFFFTVIMNCAAMGWLVYSQSGASFISAIVNG
ncbi:DUF1294 domain-containing protein [Methylotenera sp.]|uniref:DUF1294 domain-containing protein n=1 Tax=Methylotenera sp. TaxID=2051956 RepID=UPI002ED9E383